MSSKASNLAVVTDDRVPSLETPAHQLAETGRRPAITFSPEQLAVLQETYFKNCTQTEIDLALAVCQATGLDPFLKQIVFIKRWDSNAPKPGGGQGKYVLTAQPTIDGTRLIAQRSGRYAGQDGPYWCGRDGIWHEIWIREEPPTAAKVTVYATVGASVVPVSAVCMFKSYAVKNSKGELNPFWRTMPEVMIGKCAESLAMRKAFPAEYSQFGPPPSNRETSEQVETEQRIVEHDGLNWDADTGLLVQHDEVTPTPEPGAALKRVHAIANEKNIGTSNLHALVWAQFGLASLRDLSETQLAQFGDTLQKYDASTLLKRARAAKSAHESVMNAQDAPGTPDDDAIDAEYSDVSDDAHSDESDANPGDLDSQQDIGESIITDYIAAIDAVNTMDEYKALSRRMADNGIWDARIVSHQAKKLRELKATD